jgi:2-(1,2-epoxy-1,2-dihydrophenyl)acetyl-CoA isomerase
MGMALLAERVSAEDAERWGLIWKCIDDAKLMDEANALARTLAAGPTHTYGMIKKALYASSGNTLDAQLDLERDFQRDVGRHGDYREGVAAFLEKRKPEFKGN